jgi:hypothetical protein
LPQQNEKAKPRKQDMPSTSILQRVFGGPMSESTAKEWPALEASMAGRQNEMPVESAKLGRVMPMGMLSKLMYPDAYAVTGPMGTVAMNRELIEKDKQNIDDVLAHELTHVGQGKMGFMRKFYEPDKVENEAIDREALRNVRREDINLPNTGPIDPTIATRSRQIARKKPQPKPAPGLLRRIFGPEEMMPPENITGPRG